MTLLTLHEQGFAWHRRGNLRAKGYLADVAGTFRSGVGILDHFAGVNDADGFGRKLREANGCFAVIVETDRQLLAAVDPVRSFPLFFAVRSGRAVVGDDVYAIQRELGSAPETDPVSREELLRAGYTVGPRTADPRIGQIEAGEFLVWDKASAQCSPRLYFSHAHGDYVDKNEDVLLDELDQLTTRWARRLRDSVGGRTVAVPLSGGFDSRYVACALKRAGLENVVCYSYGTSASPERRVAREVAARLGYPCHLVEYNRANWQAALDSPRFMEFCRLSAQRCAIPCIQELSAREQLAARGVLPTGAVIVPGYCGDLQGGSYVPAAVNDGRPEEILAAGVAPYLFRLQFNLRSAPAAPELQAAILGRIREFTDRFPAANSQDFCSVLEDWFTRHKVAKFVLNTLRTHELFGNEWRLPLWDAEWVRWWQRIPLRLRINSALYHRFLFERLFAPLGVAFQKPAAGRSLPAAARAWLPPAAWAAVKRACRRVRPGFLRRQKDVDAFHDAFRILHDRMPGKGKFRDCPNINSLLGAWCDLQGL